LITLVTEINPCFLVTGPYTAVFKDPALFIPAAMAVIFSKIIKHHFKVGVFFEYRRLQQGFKPPGRGLEIAQFFFELDAQFPDIPVDMGETGFTAKAAWGNNVFDGVGCHGTPPLNPNLPGWIRQHYDKGAHVASICTGAFLLAETGLLDGRSATLHWGFADRFKARYPKVRLQHDRIFIDHGRLYCSAGVTAGMDLSLYLVEKFCGRQAATQSAKTMVLAMDRESQAPFTCFLRGKDHTDPLVARAQHLLEKNAARAVDYDELAHTLKMSRRSLERRFRQAAGMTPLSYLQRLRVEKARQLLEEGIATFSEVTYAVGYEDIAFFRKLFIRLTGLRPKEYQKKFAGYAVHKESF
jgi:transcriptional regulator GlxA family with amidase domain